MYHGSFVAKKFCHPRVEVVWVVVSCCRCVAQAGVICNFKVLARVRVCVVSSFEGLRSKNHNLICLPMSSENGWLATTRSDFFCLSTVALFLDSSVVTALHSIRPSPDEAS